MDTKTKEGATNEGNSDFFKGSLEESRLSEYRPWYFKGQMKPVHTIWSRSAL